MTVSIEWKRMKAIWISEEGKGERYFAQSTLVAREARRRLK